jgi:hypothetical protein
MQRKCSLQIQIASAVNCGFWISDPKRNRISSNSLCSRVRSYSPAQRTASLTLRANAHAFARREPPPRVRAFSIHRR